MSLDFDVGLIERMQAMSQAVMKLESEIVSDLENVLVPSRLRLQNLLLEAELQAAQRMKISNLKTEFKNVETKVCLYF